MRVRSLLSSPTPCSKEGHLLSGIDRRISVPLKRRCRINYIIAWGSRGKFIGFESIIIQIIMFKN